MRYHTRPYNTTCNTVHAIHNIQQCLQIRRDICSIYADKSKITMYNVQYIENKTQWNMSNLCWPTWTPTYVHLCIYLIFLYYPLYIPFGILFVSPGNSIWGWLACRHKNQFWSYLSSENSHQKTAANFLQVVVTYDISPNNASVTGSSLSFLKDRWLRIQIQYR